MKKGIVSIITLMAVSAALLCSCGNAKKASKAVDDNSPITLEIFDVAANYQGMQTGWFAKVVKDRFNIELNIIKTLTSPVCLL